MKRQNDKILSVIRFTDGRVYTVGHPVFRKGEYVGDIVTIYKRFGWTRFTVRKWNDNNIQDFYINYFD